jgi:hypothetical protein
MPDPTPPPATKPSEPSAGAEDMNPSLGQRLVRGLTNLKDRLEKGTAKDLPHSYVRRCCCGNFMNWHVSHGDATCANCGATYPHPRREGGCEVMTNHAGDCAIYSRARVCDCGRSLKIMRDGESGLDHSDRLATIATLEAQLAERDRLREALKDIAGQRDSKTIARQDGKDALNHCDFMGAWDIVITKARAALKGERKS